MLTYADARLLTYADVWGRGAEGDEGVADYLRRRKLSRDLEGLRDEGTPSLLAEFQSK
jgi:hypothetical protein